MDPPSDIRHAAGLGDDGRFTTPVPERCRLPTLSTPPSVGDGRSGSHEGGTACGVCARAGS